MDNKEYLNTLKTIKFQKPKVRTERKEEVLLEADITRKTGFDIDIETKTLQNKYFREVLYTSPNMQLVVMSVKDEIGMETHPNIDQFIRVEGGKGKAIIGGREFPIESKTAFTIPQKTPHNVINTGDGELKLYTIYAPPNHPKGVIDKTKEDAEKREKPGE
jgi:mannose-6-phosphate isomerase-like protein (cupin superfamily)